MSNTLSTPLPPRRTAEWLARLCLDHVAREQTQLDATLDFLRDVRAALLGKDHAALGEALARHQATARRAEELSRHRDAFRQEAADVLGVPPASVTLDLLAARLPADAAGRLGDARARLRQQATEVVRLNTSNASLLSYGLDFLRRFFDGLTGRSRDGRYGPAGTPTTAACDSLIDARG